MFIKDLVNYLKFDIFNYILLVLNLMFKGFYYKRISIEDMYFFMFNIFYF